MAASKSTATLCFALTVAVLLLAAHAQPAHHKGKAKTTAGKKAPKSSAKHATTHKASSTIEAGSGSGTAAEAGAEAPTPSSQPQPVEAGAGNTPPVPDAGASVVEAGNTPPIPEAAAAPTGAPAEGSPTEAAPPPA